MENRINNKTQSVSVFMLIIFLSFQTNLFCQNQEKQNREVVYMKDSIVSLQKDVVYMKDSIVSLQKKVTELSEIISKTDEKYSNGFSQYQTTMSVDLMLIGIIMAFSGIVIPIIFSIQRERTLKRTLKRLKTNEKRTNCNLETSQVLDFKYDGASKKRLITEYTKIIEKYKKDKVCADAYCSRALMYEVEKDYEKAIDDCNEAIKINPEYELAFNRRGKAYRDKESPDYDKALADFNKTLKLDSNYNAAYYNRGILYMMQKEYGKALIDLNKAIDLSLDFGMAYGKRAEVYYAMAEEAQNATDRDKYTKMGDEDKKIADEYWKNNGIKRWNNGIDLKTLKKWLDDIDDDKINA